MSDTECCGDTDTGGCYDDSRGCDDNSPCVADTCEETRICVQNADPESYYPDNADICFDQPMNTYSYDGDYCYEDTYQPVYSSLSRNNAQTSNLFKSFLTFCLLFAIGMILCKLNIYELKFEPVIICI